MHLTVRMAWNDNNWDGRVCQKPVVNTYCTGVGEFSPKKNTKVGNLENKIMDMFGIKTQVAGSDDSYLCNNDLTLAGALDVDEKKIGKKAKKTLKNEEGKSTIKEENEFLTINFGNR